MLQDRPLPRRVFLSRTSELRRPVGSPGLSYVAAAQTAVSRVGDVIVEMEYFGAADRPPAVESVDQVCSADVFVLIAGFRYGSPVLDRPGLSYTELEFETATERRIPRLVYLVSEDAEGPASHFLDHEYGERQARFRERLAASGIVVRKVLNPYELGSDLALALHGLRSRPGTAAEHVGPGHRTDRAGDDVAEGGRHSPERVAPGLAWYVSMDGSRRVVEVCRTLAAVAPDEVNAALDLVQDGNAQDAPEVLRATIDRMRSVYSADGAGPGRSAPEILAELQFRAEIQARRALTELDLAHASAITRTDGIADRVVQAIVGDVPGIITVLEPTTKLRRIPLAGQLNALYEELAQLAAARVAERLQAGFSAAVEPVIQDAVEAMSALPVEFHGSLDRYMSEVLPAATTARPMVWRARVPAEALEKELVRVLGEVDLSDVEQRMRAEEIASVLSGVAAGLAFSGVLGVLVAAALRLMVRILRDDPTAAVSRPRRIAAVKSRLATRIGEVLGGDEVEVAMVVAVRMVTTELDRYREGVVEDIEKISAALSSTEFHDWLDAHIAERRSIVDRAAAELRDLDGG